MKKVFFWILLLTALLLRIWGVGFGPFYHADEPIIINHALAFGSGDLNPHFFAIPPLVSYLCFGLFGFLFVLLRIAAVTVDVPAFQALFFDRPEIFYVLARLAAGVIPGVLTVMLVQKFWKQTTDASAGLWAAAALAVNYLHVRDSHIVYTDILMTLWVWQAVSAAVKYLRKPAIPAAVWVGLWTGLAAATKYNAVLVGVSGLVAWLIASRRPKELVVMGAASLAAFAVLNPFAILDAGHFVADIAHQATAESAVGFWHPLAYSMTESCGGGVLLVALAGMLMLFKKDRRLAAVFLAFPVLFFIKLTVFSQPHERYVMPILPFVAACFGTGAAGVLERARERGIGRGWVVFVLTMTLAFGAVKSVYADALFSRADTRDLARRWVEGNAVPGTRIAFTDPRQRPMLWRDAGQWNDLPSDNTLQGRASAVLIDQKNNVLKRESEKHRGYYLYFISAQKKSSFSSVWPLVPPSVEAMRGAGVQYVILHYGIDPVPADLELALKTKARRIIRFSPYWDERQDRSLEAWGVTFAAYAWPELASRRRFGPVLEVYEL